MQTVAVPIFKPTYSGIDEVELSDGNFSLIDGYRSDLGGTVGRPGSRSVASIDFSSTRPVAGLFWWSEQNKVIVVSDGRVSVLSYNNGVVTATGTTTRLFDPEISPTFATDGPRCFIAAGGPLVYIEANGIPVRVADIDAPTDVTHVVYIDGYILCNNRNTNRFHFSQVNSSLSWSALDFASAAGSPDIITAIHVYNREVYLFGRRSVEIWENDGQTPFSRVPGGFIEAGCSAPYSIVLSEGRFYWLDQHRRFVSFNGKETSRLPDPFDCDLQNIGDITDCRAMRIPYERNTFFVLTFPKANVSHVYNENVQEWYRWGKWNPESATYDRWVGNCYCYADLWGMHLIGRGDKEVVAKFCKTYEDDDGDVIRLARVTGSIDYGTLNRKRSNQFRIRCRRGDGLSSRLPKLLVRFCDDGVWKQPREISLGAIGDTDIVARIFRTGIFKTRKYEFVASDPVRIVFTGAEEDIEVLR